MRMQPEQYFKSQPRVVARGWQTTLRPEPERRNHHGPAATVVGATALACCLLILAGIRVWPTFRQQVCSRGKLGILNLGYEYYLATPDPPVSLFNVHTHQTGSPERFPWVDQRDYGPPGEVVRNNRTGRERDNVQYGANTRSDLATDRAWPCCGDIEKSKPGCFTSRMTGSTKTVRYCNTTTAAW